MPSEADARNALTARIIPEMVLSDDANPLTAPLPSTNDLQPADRAIKRFAVEGNAISAYMTAHRQPLSFFTIETIDTV